MNIFTCMKKLAFAMSPAVQFEFCDMVFWQVFLRVPIISLRFFEQNNSVVFCK